MAPSIRIIAPIPGKAVIGIEIPNLKREPVYLKEVLDNEAFLESSFRLPIALGVNFVGAPVVADLTKMPAFAHRRHHRLRQKRRAQRHDLQYSFKAQPDDVKFLMIRSQEAGTVFL